MPRRYGGWSGWWPAWGSIALAMGCGCHGGTTAPNHDQGSGSSDGSPPVAEIVLIEGLEGLKGTVIIDGSSTVYPVTEAVAEEFQNATKQNVKVTVGISGTGGGFKKFARGETDISDASRPILKDELAATAASGIDFVELPVCFDALTVVVNPKNDWVESITIADLKKMWEPAAEGTVKKWSDVRPQWPREELVLYGPGSDSGTFDYFTEAVVGKAKSSRGDFTPSEDDNTLVQGVEGNKHALGYFGFAYYEPNKHRLKALKIVPPGGTEGVAPSVETVLSGAYTPLSRPLFIYVSSKAAAKPEVKKFVEFYLKNVPALAAEVQYVPLPADAYAKVLSRLQTMELGSAFGGVPEVGLPISEILSRRPIR
jgi:phosphate transport system substrate-binding protein